MMSSIFQHKGQEHQPCAGMFDRMGTLSAWSLMKNGFINAQMIVVPKRPIFYYYFMTTQLMDLKCQMLKAP